MELDRITISFGPSEQELRLAQKLREIAGDRGISQFVKQAVEEAIERREQADGPPHR